MDFCAIEIIKLLLLLLMLCNIVIYFVISTVFFVLYLETDHYFFWGGMKNPEKNCLQKQKSPNKLFADVKRKNKKFAD